MKKLKISSRLENLIEVEKFVEEICEQNYLTHSYYGAILMAIEEAARNAIIHGNKLDEKKKVTISFKRKSSGLVFSVEDQGEGFDFNNVPDLMEVPDAVYPNAGKGIYLMKSLADKLEFDGKGRKVNISFDISSINQETTLSRIHNLQNYFKKQTTTAQ